MVSKLSAFCKTNDSRITSTVLEVRPLSPPEKLRVIAKNGGIFWGLGLVSVLVPVFHFVLVPLFMILGIVFAVRGAGAKGWIAASQVTCPACQRPLDLPARAALWPISLNCPHCREHFKIEPELA